ncbi:MAG: threonine/serine exporter family protein, partial [Cellulosimicrobium funkei]
MTPEPSPADEAGLEPVDLIRRSGTVLRIGRLALSAGTGSYRVKSHMTRAARALGLDRIAAHVTLTEITATSYRGPIFRTELTEVRSIGINADRLAQLERFSATLPAGADLDEVDAELDRIARRPPLYGAFLNALWAGIACAAFAFLT